MSVCQFRLKVTSVILIKGYEHTTLPKYLPVHFYIVLLNITVHYYIILLYTTVHYFIILLNLQYIITVYYIIIHYSTFLYY